MAADQTTVERVLVLVEDITRSKKMEAELATYAGDLETVVRQRTGQLFDAQKRLFAVVENTPVILWTTDAKGTVTLFLGKGAENIGLKPGEMVGRTVDEAFEGAPEVIEHHKRSMTGESVDATLVIGKRTFASHFGPLKNSKGKISGVIGVSLDVTDRG
jgi:PAS domain S-box-containing protein